MVVYHDALACLGTILVGDDDYAHRAIKSGFLPSALEILTNGIRVDKKEVLWALSNITASSKKEDIAIIMQESILMDRVL